MVALLQFRQIDRVIAAFSQIIEDKRQTRSIEGKLHRDESEIRELHFCALYGSVKAIAGFVTVCAQDWLRPSHARWVSIRQRATLARDAQSAFGKECAPLSSDASNTSGCPTMPIWKAACLGLAASPSSSMPTLESNTPSSVISIHYRF